MKTEVEIRVMLLDTKEWAIASRPQKLGDVGRTLPWSLRVTVLVKLLVVQSCPTLQPRGLQPARLLCPWDSPGKNTGVGSLSLLQWIFPTQGSNLGLLHCRQVLYPVSHQGRPRNGSDCQQTPRSWERREGPSPGASREQRALPTP